MGNRLQSSGFAGQALFFRPDFSFVIFGLPFYNYFMVPLGRVFIILGAILLVVGLFMTYTHVFSWFHLGRLPGDIRIKRGAYSFYFPLTTCIILSILITLILYIFRK